MENTLCTVVLSKINEQIERTDHLIGLLPENHLDWSPDGGRFFTVGALLGHLLECLTGFCAVLSAVEPERLRHFSALRRLPGSHGCNAAAARTHIEVYRTSIEEGFALLLGNLEHLVNHKHQLFMYLKLMGVEASSRDLYRFRGKEHAAPRPS